MKIDKIEELNKLTNDIRILKLIFDKGEEYLDDVISILKLLRNKNFSAEEEYNIILEWFYDSNDKFDKNDNIFLMFAFNKDYDEVIKLIKFYYHSFSNMKKNIIKVMYEFGDALDFDHLYELVHNINLYALSGNKNNDLLDKIISKSLLNNRNLSEINEILKEVYCKNINSSEINIYVDNLTTKNRSLDETKRMSSFYRVLLNNANQKEDEEKRKRLEILENKILPLLTNEVMITNCDSNTELELVNYYYAILYKEYERIKNKESDYAYSVLVNSNVYKYRNLDEIKKLLNYYVNEKDEVEKRRIFKLIINENLLKSSFENQVRFIEIFLKFKLNSIYSEIINNNILSYDELYDKINNIYNNSTTVDETLNSANGISGFIESIKESQLVHEDINKGSKVFKLKLINTELNKKE